MAPIMLGVIAGLGIFALHKSKTSDSPTALASPTPTPLIGTAGTQHPMGRPDSSYSGTSPVGNQSVIENLLPPEVAAGRYTAPVNLYFPAGFSGNLSPVSSLPMTPASGVKPSGVQMTGTVGSPMQGIFMEGPVYTQRGTPSTPVGTFTPVEISRPASLPLGYASPTSALAVPNPAMTGPSRTMQQTTAVI